MSIKGWKCHSDIKDMNSRCFKSHLPKRSSCSDFSDNNQKVLNSSELLQEQMLADVSVTELQCERSVSRISIRIRVRVIIRMSVGSHSRLLWTDSSSKSINMFSCFHHDEEQKLWGFSWTPDYSKSSTASALYSTYYSVNYRLLLILKLYKYSGKSWSTH